MKREHEDDESGHQRIRRRHAEAADAGSGIAILKVGRGEKTKTFVLDKERLMRHSELFRLALANKATSGIVENTVPECHPDLFEVFHLFIQHGRIFSSMNGDYQAAHADEPFKFVDDEWLRLANAWLLGDFLISCSFKDAIVDALVAKLNEESRYPVNLHEVIYPKSKAGSAVRTLLVDIAIARFRKDDLKVQGHKVAMSEFYYDVVVKMNQTTGAERAAVMGKEFGGEGTCKYHEHGEAKACYRTMI